jgi:hypothetical protein
MLERVQAKIDQPSDVFARRVHGGDPARLVQDVTGRLYRFRIVRPCHVFSYVRQAPIGFTLAVTPFVAPLSP